MELEWDDNNLEVNLDNINLNGNLVDFQRAINYLEDSGQAHTNLLVTIDYIENLFDNIENNDDTKIISNHRGRGGKKYRLSFQSPLAKPYDFREELLTLLQTRKNVENLLYEIRAPTIVKIKQNSTKFYSTPFIKFLRWKGKSDLFENQLSQLGINSASRYLYASLAERCLQKIASEAEQELYLEFRQFLEFTKEENFTNIKFKRKKYALSVFTWICLKSLVMDPWSYYGQHKFEKRVIDILMQKLQENNWICCF
jgi:hypothetical protein